MLCLILQQGNPIKVLSIIMALRKHPEHNNPEHNNPEHNNPEHNNPEHNNPTYNNPELT
jgi:hypothetical protein